eukprot:CAMPEP_0168735776 /NCGR_PEP_ID=MMETSP0724-20121128/9514_1 /TAXON_ID=265536 /ORGANISM="Amphiprora sp., Strain CCMP467" /LENGTH=241 /DNA_ID=CAMNT_0008782943 /DNA_START=89 /DNA_END=814 /DNA_ORIENTATION=-
MTATTSSTNSTAGEMEEGDFVFPKIPILPREKEQFNLRTYWMVDLSCFDEDAPLQGATPLVMRCMRVYHWKEEHARRVLQAYRQFIQLKIDQEDWYAKKLVPCGEVEKMWKEHIVDMDNYYLDMMLLTGHILKYKPPVADIEDNAAAKQAESLRKKRTHEALQQKYGIKFDEDLWLNYDEQYNKTPRMLQILKEQQPCIPQPTSSSTTTAPTPAAPPRVSNSKRGFAMFSSTNNKHPSQGK